MDDLVLEAQRRIKEKRNYVINNKGTKHHSTKYISNLFTRTLISAILVLGCAIFVNLDDKNLLFFKNKLFNETLAFTKINELYTKYFGNIMPETVNETKQVFNDTSIFTNLEPYNDSYKASVTSNAITFLESGIVVFAGNKEGFGETVIIQGVDGVDIWYSNLANINLTLYDYVEKGNILGEVKDNEAVLTFVENGEFIGYENYIS